MRAKPGYISISGCVGVCVVVVLSSTSSITAQSPTSSTATSISNTTTTTATTTIISTSTISISKTSISSTSPPLEMMGKNILLFLHFYENIFQPGILLTGGLSGSDTGSSLSTAEIFVPDLNRSCPLPAMNYQKKLHTQNGFLSCGGFETPSLCEAFTPGAGWSEEPYQLGQER